MNKKTDEDDFTDSRMGQYCFTLRLVIKHPTISFVEISTKLELQPQHGYSVGEQRKTPKGRILEGVREQTFWGYSKRINGRRRFFDAVMEFVTPLKIHADFFWLIKNSGGLVAIYIDLLGCQSIGSVIESDSMALLGSLGIDLGIELFPNSNGDLPA